MRAAAKSLSARRSSHLAGAVSSKSAGDDALPALPVAKEGWLHKRGGSHGGRHNWKKRWFVLLGDVLYYMESRSDRTPRGSVALSGCDFRIVEEECKRPHAFGIYHLTDMRIVPFFCAGDSAEEAAAWLEALHQASQGVFNLPQSVAGESRLALGLIQQLVREHEPRKVPRAELELTVVEARNLASMDANGFSDPYCVMHCGAVRCQTQVRPKTLNPRWGETFRFDVAPGVASVVQVDVFDRDTFSDDDFLGTLRLRIDELLSEGVMSELDGWYELLPRTARDTQVQGQLRLKTFLRPIDTLVDDDDDEGDEGDEGGTHSGRQSMMGGTLDDGGQLSPETAVVQQVGAALRHLQRQYERSTQEAVRIGEEHSALRGGLRDLVALPELAPFRSRAARLCVLTVRSVEARGVENSRRSGALSDLRCVLHCGEQSIRTPICRGTASPRWAAVDAVFTVESWADELVVSLVDASGPRGTTRRVSMSAIAASSSGPPPEGHHAEPTIGRLTLRLIDLVGGARVAGGSPGGGAATAGSHDAWHRLIEKQRKNSGSHGFGALAALAAFTPERAVGSSHGRGEAGGDGAVELRLVCEWRYVARRQRSPTNPADDRGGRRASADGDLDGGGAEGDLVREVGGIIEGMRARVTAQDAYAEALHGHFHALKESFAHDYDAFCSRRLGVLHVTVRSAAELPEAHGGWNGPHAPDTYVALTCGLQSASTAVARRSVAPDFNEAFAFDITEDTHELCLSVCTHGGRTKGGEVGYVRVPVAPLRDQQPRTKREHLVPPASHTAAGVHAGVTKGSMRLDSSKGDGSGRASNPDSRGLLRFEVRFRSTATAAATHDGGDGDGTASSHEAARYAHMLAMLRGDEPWLALALCETVPVERADRLASALVELLAVKHEGGDFDPLGAGMAEATLPTTQLMVVARVLFVTELDETYDENLVLRTNSTATKLATKMVRAVGKSYLVHTLRGPIHAACDAAMQLAYELGSADAAGSGACALEVDPAKLTGGHADDLGGESAALSEQLERHRHALRKAACGVLDAIFDSLDSIPPAVREMCAMLARLAEERFGEGTPAARAVVSGLLFLRVLVPCIAAPNAFTILPAVPPRAATRGLTLVSKIVNAVANGVAFGQKEPFMVPLNDVVEAYIPTAEAFFHALADEPPIALPHVAPPPADTPLSLLELSALREAHKLLSETADALYESAPTPSALDELQQLLTDLGPADTTSDGSGGDGTSIAADWSPETLVARVIAVKEALLRKSTPHRSADHFVDSRTAAASMDASPSRGLALSAPVAGAPTAMAPPLSATNLVSRFKQGLKRHSQMPQTAGFVTNQSFGNVRQSCACTRGAGASTPAASSTEAWAVAAASMAAQAPSLSLTARERRAKGRGGEGGAITEEGADDNDQASEWAASVRESRLENEGLRRQLEVAMRENDELRERLRHAEGALSSQTAEVL